MERYFLNTTFVSAALEIGAEESLRNLERQLLRDKPCRKRKDIGIVVLTSQLSDGHIPAEVIARQRALEENQREMEREIRTVSEKRLMLEQVANASDKEVPELEKEIAKWKRQELGMIRTYEKYTKTNNLVSVRDRLKVVPGEDRIARLGEPKDPAD